VALTDSVIVPQRAERMLRALTPEQRAQVDAIAARKPSALKHVLNDIQAKRVRVVKPVQGLDPTGTGYRCVVCGEPLPNVRNLTICRKCQSAMAITTTGTVRHGNQPLRRDHKRQPMKPLTQAIRSQKRDAKETQSSPLQP
jgi:ribosomal protein S14